MDLCIAADRDMRGAFEMLRMKLPIIGMPPFAAPPIDPPDPPAPDPVEFEALEEFKATPEFWAPFIEYDRELKF